MINKVILVGNVGKVDVKNTPQGIKVAKLAIATSKRYQDANKEWKEQTTWHTVMAWRGLAEVVDKHIEVGQQVYIEGELESRTWEDEQGNKRYATEVVAQTLKMLGHKEKQEQTTTYGNFV